MSASPPKEAEVEQGDPTPENSEHMDRGDDAQARDLAYNEFDVKEQDRWLPIANVARIMKMALPENAKIAKEAKECMQECVSEFISFITSEGEYLPGFDADSSAWADDIVQLSASEKCQQEKRKTVNGEDILFAMTSLGFENYAEALKIYLTKYRETQSARGENQQNRPGSSSYNPGGEASTSADPSGAPNSGGEGNILGGQLENPVQEGNPYGGVYQGHNGTAGEGY
ncbi:MAG: hypothetical protein MMC23_005625 [Stictis urceolatum]|nr:hypothetical protein [Stictis urceolata]